MDIFLKDGKIAKIGTNLAKSIKSKRFGRNNKNYRSDRNDSCARLIDMHTHLREPGFEYKETIASAPLPLFPAFHFHCLHAQHQPDQR